MTAALLRPPDWTLDALCAGHPLGPAAFDQGTPEARAVCAQCPVRHRCVLDALDTAEPDTMRGGLTPDERAAVAAEYGYERPGLPAHGTRSRYVHRDQPCRPDRTGQPCPAEITCREAHRRWAQERRSQGAWAHSGDRSNPQTGRHKGLHHSDSYDPARAVRKAVVWLPDDFSADWNGDWGSNDDALDGIRIAS